MTTFVFEDFEVWPMIGDENSEPFTINVHVNLRLVERGESRSHDSPGFPPTWEIESVELRNDAAILPVVMSEGQFITIFPDGQDVINNALEWIADAG